MDTQITNTRLSMSTKIGYGLGQIGISVPYNMVLVFLLFFFTNVAGLQPAFAGTIMLIATVWAAFADPIIGTFSDRIRSKHGRRRPLLLAIALPYGLLTWLLFTNINFSSELSKNIYYVIIAIGFYTALTFLEVPFYSLGAEITSDFDDRTRVRAIASFFVYVAVIIAIQLPNRLTAYLQGGGMDASSSWKIAAGINAVIAVIAILICWNATRGKELLAGDIIKNNQEKESFFDSLVGTMKVKPVKYIVLANFLYMLGFSIETGILVYLMIYVAQMSPGQQAIAFLILPVCTLLFLPIINFISIKLGKKKTYIILLGLEAMVFFIYTFAGTYTFFNLCLVIIGTALGNGAYWTLCFSMAYDTTEVDEFVNGKRREGVLVSYMSFAQKIGGAVAMWISGLILQFVQYDGTAATQTPLAQSGIIAMYTWIPAIFLALSVLSVFIYPLTKKKHSLLSRALELKKQGKPYSTEGFDDLI